MVEREVDHVLVGCVEDDLDPDPEEIADLELIDVDGLAKWFTAASQSFSPWFSEVMRHAISQKDWRQRRRVR